MKKYKVTNRRYRNRRIGDFLKELHLTEGRNTGFGKILRALNKNGSPLPEFETDEAHTYFITRLFSHELFKASSNDTLNDTLRDIEKTIIEILMQKPQISQKEISTKTGLSRIQIQRLMKQMQDKNIIEREGSKKSGRWVVKI